MAVLFAGFVLINWSTVLQHYGVLHLVPGPRLSSGIYSKWPLGYLSPILAARVSNDKHSPQPGRCLCRAFFVPGSLCRIVDTSRGRAVSPNWRH